MRRLCLQESPKFHFNGFTNKNQDMCDKFQNRRNTEMKFGPQFPALGFSSCCPLGSFWLSLCLTCDFFTISNFIPRLAFRYSLVESTKWKKTMIWFFSSFPLAPPCGQTVVQHFSVDFPLLWKDGKVNIKSFLFSQLRYSWCFKMTWDKHI